MRRPTRNRWLAVLLLLGASSTIAHCGSESETDEGCTPGEGRFCRCVGGGSGTRTCNDDGKTFGECVGDFGACEEIVDPTGGSPTGTTTGDQGGGPPTTTSTGVGGAGSGGGGGTPGTARLLAPCSANEECQTGRCEFGYCTTTCGSVDECFDPGGEGEEDDIFGDCYSLENDTVQLCVPHCFSQEDCLPYGETIVCSFERAVDGEQYAVCAEWDEIHLPPDDTVCVEDVECRLGVLMSERICEDFACTTGCRADEDCPEGMVCIPETSDAGTCSF